MKKLYNLQLGDFQHPKDKAALEKLTNNRELKKAIDWIVKNSVENVIKVQMTGCHIKVNDKSHSDLMKIIHDIQNTLSLNINLEVFEKWGYNIYASTDGDSNPKLVVTSGVSDLLSYSEKIFLIGHEFGHIMSNHLKFLLICRYWSFLAPIIPGSTLLQIPLFYWSRQTDLTADRVGLLACQDINSAIRTMIKMAGMPISYYNDIKIESFIQQARDFVVYKKKMVNNAIEKLSILDNRMPWLVSRAAELLEWYEGGEYSKVIKLRSQL